MFKEYILDWNFNDNYLNNKFENKFLNYNVIIFK